MANNSRSTPITAQTQRTFLLMAGTLAVVLWSVGGYSRWAVVSTAVCVVPGWWLAQCTGDHVPWYVRLTVGPCLIAMIAAWGAALSVAIPATVWAVALACATVLWGRQVWRQVTDRVIALPTPLAAVAVAVVAGAVGWTRSEAIRGLVFPPWVDAVHHALLVRVAVLQGHAPWNLEPFVPVTALTYHSGFHSIMAVLLQVSDIPLSEIAPYLLMTGQIWNVLAVCAVAGLAWSWSRSWWSVVVVLLLVGIVSLIPGYYLSWGRYTLLAGMACLPAALWVVQQSWRHTRHGLHPVWLVGTLGLLALVHFVVFLMALLWAVVWWVRTGVIPLRLWVGGVGMMLLTAPWWWLVISHTQTGAGASAMHVIGNPSHNGISLDLLWALHTRWLIPAAVLAALIGIRRRRFRSAALVVWTALVLLAANPPLIGLPYLSFFTNETVITALFLPIGLCIALAVPVLLRAVPAWGLAVLCAGVLALTLPARGQVVNPSTILATADDRAVLTWAGANLPADARVLTNATGWMWGVERGSDGGWWLLPIAGIPTTTPPVVYTYADAETVAALRATTAEVATGDGSLAFVEHLVATHPEVNYIYASERGVIKPSVLDTSNQFEVRVRSGDVALYAVIW